MSRKCHSLVFEVRQDLHAALNAGLVVLEEVVADGFGVGNLKLTLRSGSCVILFSIDQPKSFCSCFVVIWMEGHCPLSHWSSLFEEAPYFSKSLGHTGGVGQWEVQVKWIKTERHGDNSKNSRSSRPVFYATRLRSDLLTGLDYMVALLPETSTTKEMSRTQFSICASDIFEQGIQVLRFFRGQIRSCQAVKIQARPCNALQSCFCKAWTFLYHSMPSSILWWDAHHGFLCGFGSAAWQPSLDVGPFPKHLQMAFQADLIRFSSTWNALSTCTDRKRNRRRSQVASLGQTW